ncbi:hypothetical protein ACTFIY_000472 [Dictyostelium cf. discoideum]
MEKISIEIFQANKIIGKDLEFLTDKILLKMGVGIRDILDFKFEFQILKNCYNNNNNNHTNINNFNYNFNNFKININKDILKVVVNAPIININEYQYIETISKSIFCEIEKYKKCQTNDYIIIKKIIKNSSLNEEKLINEIDTIYLLDHPNLNLKNRIYQDLISFKILSAIDYLHSLEPPIIHGNINARNILLDENYQPILIDFGLSYKSIDIITKQKTQFIDPCFITPECKFKDDEGGFEELKRTFAGGRDKVSFDFKSLFTETNKDKPCFRPNSKQLLNSFWFVEPSQSSLKTTEITTTLLIDYLKKYSCYIIRDGIAMVSLPFDDSTSIIISSEFSRQPKINEKHKYFKEINQFYSKILSESFQAKIGWYLFKFKRSI